MYRGLWNLLPGGVVLKTLLAVLLAVGVFFLLMEVVFPYVADFMPYSDVSVWTLGSGCRPGRLYVVEHLWG